MSRYNFDRLKIKTDKLKNESPSNGKSFLETLLNQSMDLNGEEMPEDYLIEMDDIISTPNRSERTKRLKFLRFPKLKEMLDALAEEDCEKSDGYVILSHDVALQSNSISKIEKDSLVRNDTEEFLNNISDKLKHFAVKAKKSEAVSSNVILPEDEFKEEGIVKSITDDENIISETLADLLVFQGQNSKAMKMYHALILKFPEKSIYFAKKIEALR
jgi:hypothetical protein